MSIESIGAAAMTLVIAISLGSCRSIDGSQYSQDCEVDSDCTAAIFEDVCACSDAAINIRDEDEYLRELGEKRNAVCWAEFAIIDCPESDARCENSLCVLD